MALISTNNKGLNNMRPDIKTCTDIEALRREALRLESINGDLVENAKSMNETNQAILKRAKLYDDALKEILEYIELTEISAVRYIESSARKALKNER